MEHQLQVHPTHMDHDLKKIESILLMLLIFPSQTVYERYIYDDFFLMIPLYLLLSIIVAPPYRRKS